MRNAFFMDFSKWPPLKLSKFLNAHIFGTDALMKAKLVSRHMFLWSSNPINMFVETYKNIWLKNPRWLHHITEFSDKKYYQSIPILAWWWFAWYFEKYLIFTQGQNTSHLEICLWKYCYLYIGGWNILALGIAEIYSLNSRHQKDTNTMLISMFMEHISKWNIAAIALWYL